MTSIYKQFIIDRYSTNTFDVLEFFTHFQFTHQEEGEEMLKECFNKLVGAKRPKDISKWCGEIMPTLESEMKSRRVLDHWREVEEENNKAASRSNALQEEAIYLRTRKRTMSSVISDMDMEEESNKEARVDNEESSDYEIALLSSQSSTDSLFSESSKDSETINGKCRKYVLCFDELTGFRLNKPFQSNIIKKFDSGFLCFEDVLSLSCITYNDGVNVVLNEVATKTEDLMIINTWMKACSKRSSFFFAPQDADQLKFVSFLSLLHSNILAEMPNLKSLNNNEEEFKLKHVLPLLQYMFEDNAFNLRCDVPSEVYKKTDKTLFETITVDFTVMFNDVELVSVEVKPYNADKSLVELDRMRVAEISKKRLHSRMVTSKTSNEFTTFGITIAGDDVELYQLKFDDGKYNYYKINSFILPTTSSTYAFLPIALDALMTFKELVKSSLPTKEDKGKPYLMDVTKKMKPTTLYLL